MLSCDQSLGSQEQVIEKNSCIEELGDFPLLCKLLLYTKLSFL